MLTCCQNSALDLKKAVLLPHPRPRLHILFISLPNTSTVGIGERVEQHSTHHAAEQNALCIFFDPFVFFFLSSVSLSSSDTINSSLGGQPCLYTHGAQATTRRTRNFSGSTDLVTSAERSSDEMTSSPHRNVVEGFEALTSVSASLQYYDVRACGLVETCVDGRLSLLNLRWRQIPDSTKCDSAIYFPGSVTFLELSVLPVFSTNQI